MLDHKPTPRFAGGRLGPYEILAPLGAGGMGEVYKARDPRLGRVVALKVLPVEFAGDPARLRRFEHETRVLSGLNHPHIVTVYEVGRDDSTTSMVMELVEGKSLQSLLLSGPLPFKKLAEVAAQIATGLAAAHRAGVVHRDVKPSNVMVAKDGFVKIVDFGLAKSAPVESHAVASAPSAAAPSAVTEPGRLVGTLEYMSPEQARGQVLDSRSDQFSLGVVLYQMATGVRPFQRGSVVDTLSAILSHEPPSLAKVRPELPAPLRWVVERCLAKDPDDRFGCTQDMASVLSGIRDLIDVAPPEPERPTAKRAWVAGVVGLALLATLLWRSYPWWAAPPAPTVRFDIHPPAEAAFNLDSSAPAPPAVSPDGRQLVFGVRDTAGKSLLWVRPLDGFEARSLPGTDGATYPFWSPDSRFIGFFADGRLKKVGSTGGPIQTLGEARSGRGGTWSREGVIVFAPADEGPLHRIAAVGGASSPVTRIDPPAPYLSHRWPHFLPDGQRFLYFVAGGAPRPTSEVRAGSLLSPETRLLLREASNAVYVAPGRLLFVRDGNLVAQPFDPSSLEVSGEPTPVAESIHQHRHRRNASFTVSDLALVYQSDSATSHSRLAWFDQTGRELESPGTPGEYGGLRLSPDGQRCALEVRDRRTGTIDVWILDLRRGIASRLTSEGEINDCPSWAPDGGSVVYTSNRKGHWDLYSRALASGVETLVWQSAEDKVPTDWSPDGRFILFNQGSSQSRTRDDLWFLSLPTGRAEPFLVTAFNEREGRLSPDGRWIAYASDESGAFEVYVSTFPRWGSRRQVSASGGSQPVWRRDGKELLYLGADNRLMTVPTRLNGGLEVGVPRALFDSRLAASSSDIPLFDVSSDGTRLLLSLRDDEGRSTPLHVVVNWKAALGLGP
jgi:serine/threonine protein kinase/Tol biopolymer transport system component